MGFEPVSSGMFVHVQLVVPTAVTVVVLEFSHVTDTTPTLSDASPVNVIVCDEVETLVKLGETIVRDGGVVSFCAGGVNVTASVAEALAPPAPLT